jgi:hypothetical protein
MSVEYLEDVKSKQESASARTSSGISNLLKVFKILSSYHASIAI